MNGAQSQSATAGSLPAVAEAVSIHKRFGATVALDDVDLVVKPGESHALIGRNGAGKSTLVAIMTGMIAADRGTVHFSGVTAPSTTDREGWRQRVACVYQRSMIFPALTVAENLFINRQSERDRINWSTVNRRASAIMEEYGLRVDVTRRAGDLDVESRQMVEIARALSMGVRFIILDEPTAQLDGAAVKRLFTTIRGLQDAGATFLYISHHLHEIHEVCQAVTVLRDARRVLVARAADVSRDQLVEAMTGEARTARTAAPRGTGGAERAALLEVADLTLPGQFRGINFTAGAGEIVGIAGSGSSGAAALGECLFGLRAATTGTVKVDGQPLIGGDVPAAIEASVGYVPQDRQKEGFVPLLSIAENLTMPIARKLGRFGAINLARRRAVATKAIVDLDVKADSPEQPVSALSGGNQQKVVMGRALSNDPRLLLLVDPTSGVDVRSKETLLGAVERGAIAGRAVVLITDDVEDLRICHRVIVMFRGEMKHEFAAGWSEAELVGAIEGIASDGDHAAA